MLCLCTKIPKVPGFVRNVLKVYFFRRPVMKNMSKISIRQSYPTKIAIRILLEFHYHLLLTRKYQRYQTNVVLKYPKNVFFFRRPVMKKQALIGEAICFSNWNRSEFIKYSTAICYWRKKNTKSAWLCEKYSQSGFFNILLWNTCQEQALIV